MSKDQFWEIVRYFIIGVLTTIVSLGVYYLCVFTFLDPLQPLQLQAANVISWVCAVTFAYITNRIFVFRSHARDWVREAAAFFGARFMTLLMDMAIMFVLVTLLYGNDKIAKLISQVVVMVGNYIFSKLVVFRKKESD